MGQAIEVEARRVGDVVLFDTDRSITGQDGTTYESRSAAEEGERFPDRLAARLFLSDTRIDHIFVASNQVVVRRDGGWDDAAVDAASDVIADFFLFYREG
jgi:hypothetical protein